MQALAAFKSNESLGHLLQRCSRSFSTVVPSGHDGRVRAFAHSGEGPGWAEKRALERKEVRKAARSG